ncbi:MAG: DUF58 domain-containing protein [Rhizobiaceae bacterium]
MATLGQIAEASNPAAILGDARSRAAAIPDLLVEAQRIAATVISGWHGRRMRGSGERFWQFRPHMSGEPAQIIDWRRSARDDSSYVREKEWDAAHTVWLWADGSPSMQFRSKLARASKADRALLIILALAELLSRSGERIAWPGVANPFSARDGAARLAMRLANAKPESEIPAFDAARRFSEIIIATDFAEPADDLLARIEPLFARGMRGHLVEVCDPVEEDFPYAGHTEFRDPETGDRLSAGRAETVAELYKAAFQARREILSAAARRRGWTYTVSRTSDPATAALVKLHAAFSVPSLQGSMA